MRSRRCSAGATTRIQVKDLKLSREPHELVEKSLRDMKGGKSGGADVSFEEVKKSSA